MSCIHLVYFEFFTEYAENGSIFDYIHKKHKQPSLTQSLQWAKEVAAGQDLKFAISTTTTPVPDQGSKYRDCFRLLSSIAVGYLIAKSCVFH